MIQLKDVIKIYTESGTETAAVKGINLTIKDGEFIAVMGTSGCGKTTLLNLLGCVDRITSGEYWYNDTAVHQLSSRQWNQFRRNHISYVFQQFALMDKYTIYENIELPLRIRHVPVKERKKRIGEIVELVGLGGTEQKLPAQVSGGQRQRCAIARAYVSGTPLILADEPTGALDKKTTGMIMELLKRVNQEGKTVVVVTHDEAVASYADTVLRMEDGRFLL